MEMDKEKITVDQLDNEERLHLSILHGTKGVCKVVEESINPKMTFDRDAVALIGEIVWRKLQEMGSDMEYFAKHGKRTTIKASDVLLLARRNSSFTEHLSKLVKVQEKKKRKVEKSVADAAATDAFTDADMESNAESNDAALKNENMNKNFPIGEHGLMDSPFIAFSDDDSCF